MTIFLLLLVMFCSHTEVSAAQTQLFEDEIKQIENSIGDDVSEEMDTLGTNSVQSVITNGVDSGKIWQYLIEQLAEYSSGPVAGLAVLTAVLLLVSVAESYTCSLRYTDTKDIMGVAVSLFIVSVFLEPVSQLIASSATVISGASTIMTAYLPIMAGILMFSGHAVLSGGYYAAVVTAAQLIAKLASGILSPLLNLFLSLSISAGISTRVQLSGLIEMIGKAFKYLITFSTTIFIAILGLNSALSGSADHVADKAAKFGLSSFIPLIGSSVSEAYSALRGSVNILRSGMGVFVIVALLITFAPVMIRTLLWSAAVGVAKMIGESLCVSSSSAILNALSQFLSLFRAMMIAVSVLFIISTSVMISVGGQL